VLDCALTVNAELSLGRGQFTWQQHGNSMATAWQKHGEIPAFLLVFG
jgi:hypothetical protein